MITSRRHPLVVACRDARAGGDNQPLLLDGWHLLIEATRSALDVDAVLVGVLRRTRMSAPLSTNWSSAVVRWSRSHPTSCTLPVPSAHRREWWRWRAAPGWRSRGVFSPPPALVVATLDVQDPGNVGALVRAAEAAGASGLVTVGASADPLGWKALRAAMGSAFRLPMARVPDLEALFVALHAAELQVVALDSAGGVAAEDLDLTRPTCLALGGEGHGLPEAVLSRADARLRLPMRVPVESLNVAVAGALALYAAAAQREGGR